ncbi:MAG: SANT/Myb-like DNA-binding domain-containing protein, partial [Thaumarchaeota archaeon]|nr:SANT/Myb-like DNA-binding domain-containing protein [Nitrososphaerota archaeon]
KLPDGVEIPRPKPRASMDDRASGEAAQPKGDTRPASSGRDKSTDVGALSVELQPKVEEMDTDDPHRPIPTIEHAEPKSDGGDVIMDDVVPALDRDMLGPQALLRMNGASPGVGEALGLAGEGQAPSGKGSPSQMEEEEEEEEEEDEDDDATEIESIDFATLETVRDYIKTPPLDELPDYRCTPWYQDNQFLKSASPTDDVSAFIMAKIRSDLDGKRDEQDRARQKYASQYETYLKFAFSDDPVAVKSREYFLSIRGPVEATPLPGPEPKPEGRRTASRFATERDIERVMQESRREEEEKRERADRLEKEKYRSEKEAVIPDMYWNQEERDRDLFINKSGYLPAEKLVTTWQVLPPVVNFTEEESQLFEKAYLEFPKQWGRIAEQVPNRDFKACIQYYYLKKKELNLKDKLKKQPRRRKKGRNKQRSSALVSELGNPDNEGEETPENGENGERRRPRRAAAPSFGFESTSAADSDGTTPAGTPGGRRRGENAARNENGADKPESKRGRKRVPKEKDPKVPKPPILAPNTPATAKGNRSRSNSRAQGPEWQAAQGLPEAARLPIQYELTGPPGGGMQPPLVAGQSVIGNERVPPAAAASSISEVMAPPSLRPEPLPPTTQTFELGQPGGPERMRTPQQASSYWSVSESNDFPALLKSFGTDWNSIANHMQTKTAVMVGVLLYHRGLAIQ